MKNVKSQAHELKDINCQIEYQKHDSKNMQSTTNLKLKNKIINIVKVKWWIEISLKKKLNSRSLEYLY